jgi:AGCS family alanine or glycine:cation symporter
MGLMAIINVPVIIYLSKYAFRALKDYTKQKKEGKDPTFLSENVGIKDKLDYWS